MSISKSVLHIAFQPAQTLCILFVLSVGLLPLTGCGGGEAETKQQLRKSLQAIGELYRELITLYDECDTDEEFATIDDKLEELNQKLKEAAKTRNELDGDLTPKQRSQFWGEEAVVEFTRTEVEWMNAKSSFERRKRDRRTGQ